jgi:hypothetical protein
MLLASGDRDGYGAAEDTRRLHEWAADAELVIVESDLHGTDILLDGGSAASLKDDILANLERVAASPTTC